MYLIFEFNPEALIGSKFLGLYETIPSRDIDDRPILIEGYDGRHGENALRLAGLFRINLDKLEING